MSGLREWRDWHSITAHVVAPAWQRVPEKARWWVVGKLDHSRRFCWASLVDAAFADHETDPCDVNTPLGAVEKQPRCSRVCDWSHPDHAGTHACSCYCGKFQFKAADGAIDRRGDR